MPTEPSTNLGHDRLESQTAVAQPDLFAEIQNLQNGERASPRAARSMRRSVNVVSPQGDVTDVSSPLPTPSASARRIPPDLEKVPVTSITLEFRPVNQPDTPESVVSGNSDHAFIVISRANGFSCARRLSRTA